MTLEILKLAEEFRQRGYFDQANRLTQMAEAFKDTGVPETWPIEQESMESLFQQLTLREVPRSVLRRVQGMILEIMKKHAGTLGRHRGVSIELARDLNDSFGKKMSDSVLVKNLRVPTVEDLYPDILPEDKYISELSESVPIRMRIFYNRALGTVQRKKLPKDQVEDINIGYIRSMPYTSPPMRRGIGAETLQFLLIAFEPENPEK